MKIKPPYKPATVQNTKKLHLPAGVENSLKMSDFESPKPLVYTVNSQFTLSCPKSRGT